MSNIALKDLPHPLNICCQLLHYACWPADHTKNMTGAEIKAAAAVFFGAALVAEASLVLTGKHPIYNGE